MDTIENEGVSANGNIVNVVTTFCLKVAHKGRLVPTTLNLPKFALCLTDVLHLKCYKNFAAATLVVEGRAFGYKNCVGLIFRTGVVVFTGSNTEGRALAVAQLIVRALVRSSGVPFHLTKFMVQNLVCNMKMKHEDGSIMKLDLLAMKEEMGDKAEFETEGPRAFPACRVRPSDNSKAVILAYLSGAVVFTGAKDRNEAHVNHKEAHATCKRFPLSKDDCNIPKYMMHTRKRKKMTSTEGLKRINARLKKARPQIGMFALNGKQNLPQIDLGDDSTLSLMDLESIQETAKKFNLDKDFGKIDKKTNFLKIQDKPQVEENWLPYNPISLKENK